MSRGYRKIKGLAVDVPGIGTGPLAIWPGEGNWFYPGGGNTNNGCVLAKH